MDLVSTARAVVIWAGVVQTVLYLTPVQATVVGMVCVLWEIVHAIPSGQVQIVVILLTVRGSCLTWVSTAPDMASV